VARAKRTARAEARRRYRAATEPAFDIDDETTDSPDVARAVRQPRTAKPEDSQKRVGIFGALRAAYRPVHMREDLAALPLLLRHRAVFLPVLAVVASAVLTVLSRGSNLELLARDILFANFVATPAIGGVFLAGFLAPRASWLIGALISIVGAGVYIVMGVAGLLPVLFAERFNAFPIEASISTLSIAPVWGAFFAAAAAWYRRFLQMSAPARPRPQAAAAPRRGDGRSRGSANSQKAGARR
jgi:hypothetical protein